MDELNQTGKKRKHIKDLDSHRKTLGVEPSQIASTKLHVSSVEQHSQN